MPSPFYATASHRLNLRALLGTSNISDVDAGFAALVADAEANVAGYAEGAALPAAGISGRIFRVTTTSIFYIDDGSVWQQATPGPWQTITPISMVQGADLFACRLEPGGGVRLKGSLGNLTGTTIANLATIATLPVGYRPAPLRGGVVRVITSSTDTAVPVAFRSSGTVQVSIALPDGTSVMFDGIAYAL